MKVRITFLFIMLMASAAFGANPDDVLGRWQTDGDSSEVEIYQCGDKLCGKVAWLKHPDYVSSKDGPVGAPKIDRKNPDPVLRNRPIIGLQVMEGLTAAGDNLWKNGVCYDPASGNTYKCKINLASHDRLEVRGFIGFSLFGRTYVLTRKEKLVKSPPTAPRS